MILWAMLALFVVVTLIFVIITLLFPEWVGITGKVALEYERQQRGDPPAGAPDVLPTATLNELPPNVDSEAVSPVPTKRDPNT